MTAQLINGKAIAQSIKDKIKQTLLASKTVPGLAVILVGDDPASHIYVHHKQLACNEVGIRSVYHPLPATVTEATLVSLIDTLDNHPDIHGILLQLPLPTHLDAATLLDRIDPHKDVDGFHPYNFGCLAQGHPRFRPCTPYGVMLLLQHIQQPIKGQHAVVVGASQIVGRPMALELLMAGATVTICHDLTRELAHHVKQADILVTAVGKPSLIKGEWIKEGSTVIDIGITRLPSGKLSGDVDFEAASKRAAWITPVPGGVGPMTVAVLMMNTLRAAGYFLPKSGLSC